MANFKCDWETFILILKAACVSVTLQFTLIVIRDHEIRITDFVTHIRQLGLDKKLSVRMPVHMEQLGSHWRDFHEIK
jgi:hypothetical protein